ncbi:MAG: hypothetical protein JWP76_1074, partial [Dactylosporangium sp.]|nr:hypothetical protein [Dactylosporangium sp.]
MTRHGNAHLCTILVEAAWATDHTHSRLGARLRRLKRRMGKKSGPKAAVAVAHTILIIIWHLLVHAAPTPSPAETTFIGAAPRCRRRPLKLSFMSGHYCAGRIAHTD